MQGSIGIVGTGWVGSSVAISTLHTGVARELLLSDARADVAEGDAMDLAHGAGFYPPAHVGTATIGEMAKRCAAIVVCAGRGGKADETRLQLLRDNAKIMRSIGEQLRAYEGLVVVVSNPVDVLVRVMQDASKLPAERVIGTGTMLDTARLRQTLGEKLKVDPRSVHANVIGEHGDSEVMLWSTAHVAGKPLRAWPGWKREEEASIEKTVRCAAYEIIRRKGATNHAIGLVAAALLEALLRGERRVLTVSRVWGQIEGLRDPGGVALSLPAIVDETGVVEAVVPQMDETEVEGLRRSAEVLRAAYASL